jgi:hypothetical protein
MSTRIEQRSAGLLPPARAAADSSRYARHGHYSMVAAMVRDAELALERLASLDEIPLPLLARLARALNLAERDAMRRVKNLEEASD